MKIVHYKYMTPTTFQQPFFYDTPIAIVTKHFIVDDIVPLHYKESIEILICDNLVGDIKIENNIFKLGGQQVFVIPPYIVHSNNIKKCKGIMYVIKISFGMLNPFLNLPALFKQCGNQINQIAYVCPEYDSLFAIVTDIINNDNDILLCIGRIIELFRILFKYSNENTSNIYNTDDILHRSNLHKLINWTRQNFQNEITLDDVSNYIGYSKYYFCKQFKAITGTTYNKYLQSVRISHACKFLINNISIKETCYKCGFNNVSYFTKVFKKIQGLTPKQYLESLRGIVWQTHFERKDESPMIKCEEIFEDLK